MAADYSSTVKEYLSFIDALSSVYLICMILNLDLRILHKINRPTNHPADDTMTHFCYQFQSPHAYEESRCCYVFVIQ